MQRLFRFALVLCCIALSSLPTGRADAQQIGVARSPILTIESDRLYTESAFGRRVAREVEADSAVLAAENARIQAELTEEEQTLTDRRPEMEPEAFRVLADAFDTKVQAIREEQLEKTRQLTAKQDESRAMFFNAARPILENLMREAGAAVVLERATVFLSTNVSDVTDLAIGRIDQVLGEGPEVLPGGEN
ncbi:MAG: OmpH family outer membrane protein [Paracoccaceae bacterium]